MKSLKLLVSILALVVTCAFTQPVYTPYAYESLTVSNTSKGFTSTKLVDPTNSINSANYLMFTVNCASGTTCILRFTVDGTTPTTAVGMRALYGDNVQIFGFKANKAFRGIRETSTDVLLDTTFYR